MWRLLFLFLRQRWRGDPAAQARRGLNVLNVPNVPHLRRAVFATSLFGLALGVAAWAWSGAWRGSSTLQSEAATTSERVTLRVRVARLEAPPLLVFLDRGGSDKAQAQPAERVRLTSINSVFEPAFQVAPLAARVEIGNTDPVAHNTHLFDANRRTLFNVALPQQGVSVQRVLVRSGLFEARCDLHTWMRAAVFVPPNAHYLVIREAGEFVLPDIAPGRWRLHQWSAARGERVRPIELATDTARVLDLDGH